MAPKWSLNPPRWHRSADQVSDLKAGIDLGHGPRRTLSEVGVGFSVGKSTLLVHGCEEIIKELKHCGDDWLCTEGDASRNLHAWKELCEVQKL